MSFKATSIGGIRRSGRGGNTPQKQVNDQINIITNPPVLPPPENPGDPPPKFNTANPPVPLPVMRPWKDIVDPTQPIPPGQLVRLVVVGGKAR
jgi:hypothetical protein